MQWSEELEEEKDWIDLKIVDIWAEGKRYVSGTFPSGIYIREEIADIIEFQVLNGAVSVWLPSDADRNLTDREGLALEILEYLEGICPACFASDSVFYSEKWNCGFAFGIHEVKEGWETVYEWCTKQMEEFQEEIVFYAKEVKEYLTFTVKGYGKEDTQLYSFPFFIEEGEHLLAGIICCQTEDAVIWKKLSYEILHGMHGRRTQ